MKGQQRKTKAKMKTKMKWHSVKMAEHLGSIQIQIQIQIQSWLDSFVEHLHLMPRCLWEWWWRQESWWVLLSPQGLHGPSQQIDSQIL